VLAVAAGCIVAVCYSELSHVEVGPMTGNAIATGVSIGARGSNAMLTRAVAIVAFVLGVAAGVAVAEECSRHRVRRVLASTLGLELLLLAAFLWWVAASAGASRLNATSPWPLDGLVALPALAMGMQTAALRRVGGQTVRTVYVSGVVTRAAEEAVRYVYWRRDRRRGATQVPWHNEPTPRRIALLAGIFVMYAVGAIAGGWLDGEWHVWALVAPLALLAVVACADAAIDVGPPAR
jgi:uncharacterized membrane protein YoaK (UPF0700 family)